MSLDSQVVLQEQSHPLQVALIYKEKQPKPSSHVKSSKVGIAEKEEIETHNHSTSNFPSVGQFILTS